jgi:type II secretion system protein H
MVPERIRGLNRRGWSLGELLVVAAVIGILAAIAIPLFASYLRSATVRAGAQEMRAGLQQAKQLAIRSRQNICVQAVVTGYRFLQNTCTGPAIIMAGTDGTGTFRLQNNVTVTSPAPVTFTPLGAAAPAGRYTVTAPNSNPIVIQVSAAGRIQ